MNMLPSLLVPPVWFLIVKAGTGLIKWPGPAFNRKDT